MLLVKLLVSSGCCIIIIMLNDFSVFKCVFVCVSGAFLLLLLLGCVWENVEK